MRKMSKKRCRLSMLVFISALLFSGLSAFLCVDTPAFAQDNSMQRIISLSPPKTEELYLLGVEDRIVGVTTYCQNPPQARQKEKIGAVTNVNIEKIVGLKPDLVLATSLTDLKSIEKLKDLGIRVEVSPRVETFTHLCEEFIRLGRIVGEEKRAQEIVQKATSEVNDIKNKIKSLAEVKAFVQIGANPLFTATEESFINDFIEFAGGVNIARDSITGVYSREKVIEANPAVIIIVIMGISGEEEKEVWERFEILDAVKNNRVHILDSYGICSPTPVTFVKGVKDIVHILYPDFEAE